MDLLTKKIVEDLLNKFSYRIKSVSGLEQLGVFDYTAENIKKIREILTRGMYTELSFLMPAKNLMGEDVTVFRFKDQEGHFFYSYYYDSIELQHDPEVMDIFPEINKSY